MQTVAFILFNLPALAVLISAFFLFFKGRCSRSVRISMTLVLLSFALSMAFYAEYFNPLILKYHFWGFDFMFCLVSPFIAPIYFLFLNRLTDVKKTPTLNALIFLPAILYGAMLVTAHILMSDADRHAYIWNVILGQSIQMDSSLAYDWMVIIGNRIFKVFVPVETIIVMIYGEFRLSTYIRLLEDYYSSTNSGNVNKLRGIHTLTILVAALCLFISIIPVYDVISEIWLIGAVILIEVVLVIMIVTYVMQIEYSAEALQSMIESDSVSASSDPMSERIRLESLPSLIARIDAVMERDELYLRPELSLVTLAEYVGTNRTYVSKAIKDAKGCNFSDYVNRYRLDYAVELMKRTPREDIIVQNVAMQCGCGSIQTFYRYFKLFFKETPTQWIERNK